MLSTPFTKLVGCEVPIQMAGMGTLATPRLAAAVSEAGGLGMIGLSGWPATAAIGCLEETRRLTSRPFGANFIVADAIDKATGKPDPDAVRSVEEAATRSRVVEFFYDHPNLLSSRRSTREARSRLGRSDPLARRSRPSALDAT